MGVWEPVLRENTDADGAKTVSPRLVDKGNADRPNCRSRSVVPEIKKALKRSDVPSAAEFFSGMPPLESVKTLLSVRLPQCHFSLEISVLSDTGMKLSLVCGFFVVFLSRSRRLVSFLSFCVVVAAFTFEVSGQEMGGDGFQTQKRKSWIPGKVRAEKVLADAIAIDGRKEWICKFCSETYVWAR